MRPLLVLLVVLGALAPTGSVIAQTAVKSPPTTLVITAKPVRDENATYDFEVTLSRFRDAQGLAQLNVVTTVSLIGDGQLVRFREIRQKIAVDASTFASTVDGKQFLMQAEYVQPLDDPTVPRRLVPTTYGLMFDGGRVGITVKRTS